MFSQFRQAVENLAPVPRHPSDGPGEPRRETASRSNSLDSPLRPSSPVSSNQLAESALSNLRKSLATQRSGSVGSSHRAVPPREGRAKSTLEDRLRAATFAIGEASGSTSPNTSAKPSPPLMTSTVSHPLSPSSTPLPESPITSPRLRAIVDPVILDIGPPAPVADPLQTSLPKSPPEPIPEVSAFFEPQDEISQNGPPVESSEVTNTPETEVTQTDVPETLEPKEMPHDEGSVAPNDSAHATNVEELQERLKQVEQRFTDVSTSFKKLQAEKLAADLVLREMTPLENIQDSAALRDYLKGFSSKTEIFQDEIKRLNGKLEIQDDRIEELRDTHRLESKSQSEQIENLRTQLKEAEALIVAAQKSDTQAEERAASQKAEIDRLHKDVDSAKLSAKEEEEKRVKAISLLKTVRQKLVKAEKEREDTAKEVTLLRDKVGGDRDRDLAERAKLRNEIDAVNAEREMAVTGLKTQFDKEIANIKDRYEKEIFTLKGQFELEGVATKNAHVEELASKNSHIHSLEQSLNTVTRDKNAFFDTLQLRQAEIESAQSHLESLQSQNTELQYQLREMDDRFTLLKEDLAEAQREQETRSREPAPSANEVARLLSATEAKYETKISDLKRNLVALEKERNDNEAEWSRKLRDKTKETEDLKRVVGSAAGVSEEHEEIVAGLKADIMKLEGESRLLQEQISELRQNNSKVKDIERSWKTLELELSTKISTLEQQAEESKHQETQLRLGNKTLREELRKVQNSAALLERQRNPGVGYWTSRTVNNNPTDSRTSIQSVPSGPPSRVASPVSASSTNEEEVNLEYLRNVILQFLEHKEMRPNLVKVLSIILRFTPQETRRLIAKV